MDKIKAYGILLYKIEKETIKILLCKSVSSLERWGCLKGMQLKNESAKACAKREFYEESSIDVKTELFEKYFSQKNREKDIGIWIVNINNIENINKYFNDDTLFSNYLSWENSKVKFFDIKNLPPIKKKQKKIIKDITDFLQNRNQFH